MVERKKQEVKSSDMLFFRKNLSERKRVQTAEGWRRTVLKLREASRKKAKEAKR